MNTRQSDIPADAKPLNGFIPATIDVADKYRRGKTLNFKEKSDFRMICDLGANQLVDCYGEYFSPGEYLNVYDFVTRCNGCPHACIRMRDYWKFELVGDARSKLGKSFLINALDDCVERLNPKAFVYFISDGRFVKIGKATNISQRMRELQTSNPNKLSLLCKLPCKSANAATNAERRLHNLYSEFRVRGEWFDVLPFVTSRGGVAEWLVELSNG